MPEFNITDHLIGFLYDTMYLAGIPLLLATTGALFIAVFQAMTQIQDQTLSQTAKIVIIVIVFLVIGPSLVQPLILRTERVFSDLENY